MTELSRELALEYLATKQHKVKPRGPRVTGEAREELVADIVARYGRRQSVRDIAAAVGHSYGFVHKILEQSGVHFKSRGGANRSPR